MTEFAIPLNGNDKKPLYDQIYRYIADSIMKGEIIEGDRMPGKRTLAKHLGVSISTVENAYAILLAEGFLRSEARKGFFACRVESRSAAREEAPQLETATQREPCPFAFSTSEADAALFPYKLWAKLTREVLTEEGGLLNRGDGMGDMNLRVTLCDFLNLYRGVRLRPEQLLIGAGLEYLLGVLVHLVPNKAFALEDPGYHSAFRAVHRSGGRMMPIELDEQGMSVGKLHQSGAGVAYVTPSHQFPMGTTMSAGRRADILNWAESKPGRFVVEDDYDSEFRYNIRPIPAMQGYDARGVVVYAGTFSRTLAPSIRIAYLGLPDALLVRYRQLFGPTASTVSRFEQQTLEKFIKSGGYERHLRRAGNAYKQRMQTLVGILSEIDGLRLFGEGAGLHFLARHPSLSEEELVARARKEGVRVHGLSEFHNQTPIPLSTVVLGYAGMSGETLRLAGESLKRAWT